MRYSAQSQSRFSSQSSRGEIELSEIRQNSTKPENELSFDSNE